LSRIST